MSDVNLDRFVSAQNSGVVSAVERELTTGRKQSHWMWFVFPQLAGLGSSPTAHLYAIRSLDEARAYLSHPTLGPRLLKWTALVNAIEGKTANQVFGWPDDLKFRSSMTLFHRADPSATVFRDALTKYYQGEEDPRTIELLPNR